jgi:pyruvate dehydrogenase E1 component alpha subunit
MRAAAYGIPGKVVDGQDVLAVYEASLDAVQRAREGAGPSLIECQTYRFKGHARFDPASYRPKEEEEEWKKRDPIKLWGASLTQSGMAGEGDLKAIHSAVKKEVDAAVDFAVKSPPPEPDICLSLIFANGAQEVQG